MCTEWRLGNNPGPASIPFPTLLTETMSFRPMAALEAKWGQAKRWRTNATSGCKATMLYFAAGLARREAKLYDGALGEWGGKPQLPVDEHWLKLEPETGLHEPRNARKQASAAVDDR